MSKFLYFCSLLAIGFLVAGSYLFPNDTIMWFASTAADYNIARGVLGALLVVLLFTQPPRHVYFRMLLGMVALGLVGWTAYAVGDTSLKLLDALLYVQLSVMFSIAALEISYQDMAEPVRSRHFDDATLRHRMGTLALTS